MILTNAEALKGGVFGPMTEAQKKALASMERGVSRWLEIQQDILTLAGITRLPTQAKWGTCNLDEVSQQALSFTQEYAARKGLTLHRECTKNLEGKTDVQLCRQMLIALLLACIECVPPGTAKLTLALSSHATGWLTQVSLDVTDSEASVTRAALLKNSHYELATRITALLTLQLSQSAAHEGVKVIAMSHAAPEPQPTADEATQSTTTAPSNDAPTRKAKRILIAEDQGEILQVLRLFLEGEGHQVITATNGQAAWQLCLSEPPDLLLLDMQMPIMSGPELIRHLRTHPSPSLSTLPIITISGLDEAGERRTSLASGATAHIAKPFHLRELSALLQRVLPA